MYDPYKELNFDNVDSMLEELTYHNAVYNHRQGMSWDEIKRIFPDNGPLMEARYKAENGIEEG